MYHQFVRKELKYLKIGAFITVRMGSTRLPNKALLEIKGIPTIVHLINRIKYAKTLDKIVLCTTTNPEDEVLCKLAEKCGIYYFAGNEKDILKRHYDAAIFHEIDFVINIDGDDLFCDPKYIEQISQIVREEQSDYDVIETKGLPFGVNSFGYRIECLKSLVNSKSDTDSDTGWGEFFRENPQLKKKIIPVKQNHKIDARMSLDYEEDLLFFKEIIERLYNEGEYFSLDDIIRLLKENPHIVEINKEIEEIYWKNYQNKKILKD